MNQHSKNLNQYMYNGNMYTCRKYAELIHKITGFKMTLLIQRIRKGWAIERLMLPDAVTKGVHKYGLDGKYIKTYNSISDAIRDLRKTAKCNGVAHSNIKISCNSRKGQSSGGYMWRYVKDIKDVAIDIETKPVPFKSNKTLYELRELYTTMIYRCHNVKGPYFNNPRIKVCERWIKSWDNFCTDMLPLYKKAKAASKNYTSRLTGEKIKPNQVWMSRKDKTDGYLPLNTYFTTPEWCMRSRPDTHRVTVDGKIMSVPQIYDLNPDLKGRMTECNLRDRVVKNRDLFAANHGRQFNYQGKEYSAPVLAEMVDVPASRLRSYIVRDGLSVEDAIEKARNFESTAIFVKYCDKKYRLNHLIKKLIHDSDSKLPFEIVRSRVRASITDDATLELEEVTRILNSKVICRHITTYRGKEISIVALAKKLKMPYHTLLHRQEKGWTGKKLIAKSRNMNRIFEYNGKSYKVLDIAEELKVTEGTIYYRLLHGWTIEEIFANTRFRNVVRHGKVFAKTPFKGATRHLELQQEEVRCAHCGIVKDRTNYYAKDGIIQKGICKECISALGKHNYKAQERKTLAIDSLFILGQRKCTECKEIKLLAEFSKDKNNRTGYMGNCKKCMSLRHYNYMKAQTDNLGKVYLTQYAMKMFKVGVKEVTDEMRDKAKKAVLEKRVPKYKIDGKEFLTMNDLARYIEEVYKIPITCTVKRLQKGKSPEECTISEYDYRSNARCRPIKIVDSVTGQVFTFKGSSHTNGMFQDSTLARALRTGELVGGGKRSKYPNPCKITYV